MSKQIYQSSTTRKVNDDKANEGVNKNLKKTSTYIEVRYTRIGT
jgi:hypothetical protein